MFHIKAFFIVFVNKKCLTNSANNYKRSSKMFSSIIGQYTYFQPEELASGASTV